MKNRPVLITGVGRRAGLHLAETFLQRGQPVIGSPVPSWNRIFIRGENHLFCLGSPDEEFRPRKDNLPY